MELDSLILKTIRLTTDSAKSYGEVSYSKLFEAKKKEKKSLSWSSFEKQKSVKASNSRVTKVRNYLFIDLIQIDQEALFFFIKSPSPRFKPRVLSMFTEQMICLVELLTNLFACSFTLFLNTKAPSIRDPILLNHVCKIAYSGHYLSRLNIVLALSYYCFLAYSKIEFLWTYLLNISENSMYKDQRQMYRYLWFLISTTTTKLMAKSEVLGFKFKIKGKFTGRPGDRRKVFFFVCEKSSVADVKGKYEIHYLQPKNLNGATGWTITLLRAPSN